VTCACAQPQLQPVCPASVDRLPVTASALSQQVPSRAQTVTNNLALVNAGSAAVKDTNIRGAGSMEGVETVRVTDITTGSAFTKSIGSLFSSINKSVSSAFNSLMAVPAATGAGEVPSTTAGTPTQPAGAAPVHTEINMTSVAQQQQQRAQFAQHDGAYQQLDAADWHRVHPQSYAEPSTYRGNTTYSHRCYSFIRAFLQVLIGYSKCRSLVDFPTNICDFFVLSGSCVKFYTACQSEL